MLEGIKYFGRSSSWPDRLHCMQEGVTVFFCFRLDVVGVRDAHSSSFLFFVAIGEFFWSKNNRPYCSGILGLKIIWGVWEGCPFKENVLGEADSSSFIKKFNFIENKNHCVMEKEPRPLNKHQRERYFLKVTKHERLRVIL